MGYTPPGFRPFLDQAAAEAAPTADDSPAAVRHREDRAARLPQFGLTFHYVTTASGMPPSGVAVANQTECLAKAEQELATLDLARDAIVAGLVDAYGGLGIAVPPWVGAAPKAARPEPLPPQPDRPRPAAARDRTRPTNVGMLEPTHEGPSMVHQASRSLPPPAQSGPAGGA